MKEDIGAIAVILTFVARIPRYRDVLVKNRKNWDTAVADLSLN